MLKLDFKKFKKIATDEKSSTLVSPQGHEIKIAHSLLSEKMKDEIKKIPMSLAEGGETKEEESITDDQSAAEKLLEDKAALLSKNEQNDLGPLKEQEQIPSDQNGMQNLADSAIQTVYPNQIQTPMAPEPERSPANIDQPQNPIEVPNQVPNQAPSFAERYLNNIDQQKRGETMMAAGEQRMALNNQEIERQHQEMLEEIASDADLERAKLQKEVDHVTGDIAKDHINPNQYMENLSAPQRVMTAIGLILGGMGGGLLHQANPAAAYLDAQIQRDVESQKVNLGKKETILSSYMHQFGHIDEAQKMATAVQSSIYSSKLKQEFDKSTDPLVRGRLQVIFSKLDNDADMNLRDIALKQAQRNALNGLTNGNQGMNTEYLDPKVRERVVPLPTGGLGLAYSAKEAEDSKKSFDALMSMKDTLHRMRDFQSQNGRTVPYSDNDKIAQNLKDSFTLGLNHLYGLNRLNERELALHENVTPHVGAVRQELVSKQLNNLEDMVDLKLREEYKNHLEGMNDKLPNALGGSGQITQLPRKVKNGPGK